MGMGLGLLAGALLARAGRIRFHAACQSVIVLLNLALIVLMMLPSFRSQVLPKLPGGIGKPYYALATAHAGTAAPQGGVCELPNPPLSFCFPLDHQSECTGGPETRS